MLNSGEESKVNKCVQYNEDSTMTASYKEYDDGGDFVPGKKIYSRLHGIEGNACDNVQQQMQIKRETK